MWAPTYTSSRPPAKTKSVNHVDFCSTLFGKRTFLCKPGFVLGSK